MPKKRTPFNVELSAEDRAKLSELSDAQGTTRAHVLRKLIAFAHAATVRGKPICATGAPCMAPHLFAPPPTFGKSERVT